MNKQDEFVRYLSRESSRIFGFILALAVNRNDAPLKPLGGAFLAPCS